MAVALVVAAAAVASLFAPAPTCAPPLYAAVRDLNHMFVGARHDLRTHCAEGNATLGLDSDGLQLQCSHQTECLDLLTAYITPVGDVQYPTARAAIEAAAEVVGATTLTCNTTAECDHPHARCALSASIPDLGYCEPLAAVQIGHEACAPGFHATCEELVAGSVGFVVGYAVWILWEVVRVATSSYSPY